MEKITFAEEVYLLCRRVPRGKVTTYKEIARVLGIKGYQAIGQALRCNPYAPSVPCHRVVKSNGDIGGFKGKISPETVREKVQLLKSEGIILSSNKINLSKFFYAFDLK